MHLLLQDWRSKIVDGLLAGLMLIMGNLLLLLLTPALEQSFGKAGILIYPVILLAVAIYCLERSVVSRFSELRRAWFGLAAGILGWTVIELANWIGNTGLGSVTSMLTFLMMGSAVSVLWRRVIPVGLRFFFAVLLMAWGGHLLVNQQLQYASFLPELQVTLQITGFAAIIGAAGVCLWLVIWSERRMQRMWGATLLWFFVMMSIYVFRGGLM
jgi:hypothetical protein